MSKKNAEKEKLRGAEGFEAYYSELYTDRWSSLKKALLEESSPKALKAGGEKTYYLDSASVLAASCLPLDNAEEILDMCAAPGGKTLVLAKRMKPDARLTSNERSFDRKMRLSKVVVEHLPLDIRSRITVTNKDAALMCKSINDFYDAILLDAPCSSERHVLQDPKYLEQWSPSRVKTLAMEQWALLSSAWRMLKAGGYILYSTCALAPKENDEVLLRLLKKFPEAALCTPDFSISRPDFFESELPIAEKTEAGYHVLPDKACGAGPIYFSLIKKEK